MDVCRGMRGRCIFLLGEALALGFKGASNAVYARAYIVELNELCQYFSARVNRKFILADIFRENFYFLTV